MLHSTWHHRYESVDEAAMAVYLFAGMHLGSMPDAIHACACSINFQIARCGTLNNLVQAKPMPLIRITQQQTESVWRQMSNLARQISNQAPGLWRRGHGRFRFGKSLHTDAQWELCACPTESHKLSRITPPWGKLKVPLSLRLCLFVSSANLAQRGLLVPAQPIFTTQLAVLNNIFLDLCTSNMNKMLSTSLYDEVITTCLLVTHVCQERLRTTLCCTLCALTLVVKVLHRKLYRLPSPWHICLWYASLYGQWSWTMLMSDYPIMHMHF